MNGSRALFLSCGNSGEHPALSSPNSSDSLLPLQPQTVPGLLFRQTVIAAIRKLLHGDGSMPRESPGRLCMATVDSTLVITSSNTKNKLMLSAEVGQCLLRGLLSGLGTVPPSNCSLESLLTVLIGKISAPQRQNLALLGTDAPQELTPFLDGVSNIVHTTSLETPGQEYIDGPTTLVARRQGADRRESLSKRSLPSTMSRAAQAVYSEKNLKLLGASQTRYAKRIRIMKPSFGTTVANNVCKALRTSRDIAARRLGQTKLLKKAKGLSGSVGDLQVQPAAAECCEAATSSLIPYTAGDTPAACQPAALKRPAQDPAAPVLPPAKRQLNSSHIPAGKEEEKLATLLRPPTSCVVPRDRLVLLHCFGTAEARRRRRVKQKPKPVTSR